MILNVLFWTFFSFTTKKQICTKSEYVHTHKKVGGLISWNTSMNMLLQALVRCASTCLSRAFSAGTWALCVEVLVTRASTPILIRPRKFPGIIRMHEAANTQTITQVYAHVHRRKKNFHFRPFSSKKQNHVYLYIKCSFISIHTSKVWCKYIPIRLDENQQCNINTTKCENKMHILAHAYIP